MKFSFKFVAIFFVLIFSSQVFAFEIEDFSNSEWFDSITLDYIVNYGKPYNSNYDVVSFKFPKENNSSDYNDWGTFSINGLGTVGAIYSVSKVDDKIIFSRYMTNPSIIDVTSIANKYNCRCAFTVNNVEYVQDGAMNVNQVLLDMDLNKFLETNFVKQIFIRGDSEVDINNTYMDIIKLNDVKIVNESTYFHTGIVEKKGLWFSVGHKDVNKGAAILKLCQYLNVDLNNTYGFGNDYNDIKMFETVKYSIVMENANDYLKKKAKIIAKSNNEDGVADFLEEIFLKGE
jgi:hydroxymethylpyrimidine pyrophosphatase-like HAD family hydrolase